MCPIVFSLACSFSRVISPSLSKLPDNDQNVALCTNEQPNFINLEHCKVSFESDVCVKEYIDPSDTLTDVQMVINFSRDSMAKLHNATLVNSTDGIDRSRYLYAVDGLLWDETVSSDMTTFPCTPNKQPVSRWRPKSDLDAVQCTTNNLHTQTEMAFVHALETSNDDNAHVRDIYLWNDRPEDGCHEDDYEAAGMLVMTSEGCWENVYADHL